MIQGPICSSCWETECEHCVGEPLLQVRLQLFLVFIYLSIITIRDCYDTEEMTLEQNQFRFKDFIDQQTGEVL